MARKKLTDKQKLNRKINKMYESYNKQYKKSKALYGSNLAPKLNKRDYKNTYIEYYENEKALGNNRPQINKMIIKDQKIITERQSKAWSKNLKKHLEEWKQMDEGKLDSIQKELIKTSRNLNFSNDMFYKQENFRLPSKLLDIIAGADYWEESIGS